MKLFTYGNFPLLVSGVFLIIGLGVILVVSIKTRNKYSVSQDFINKLKHSAGELSSDLIKDKPKSQFLEKWQSLFGDKIHQAGFMLNKSAEEVSFLFFFGAIGLYALFGLMFKNIGIGLVPVGVVLGVVQLVTSNIIKSKQEIFSEQIPTFLSVFKSNIQAGETPDRALISAIESTERPLYDELKIGKALTETGSFKMAITRLRETTTHEVLSFLFGCIDLGSDVGANLEDQIETIEELLNNRRAIRRRIEIASSSAKPLIYVSMAIIPGLFMFTYLTNPQTQAYWFNSLLSWIMFILAVSVYIAGLLAARWLVSTTEKL